VAQLTARGIGHIYVDGGLTNQAFLRAGLIQRVTITSLAAHRAVWSHRRRHRSAAHCQP
jgi:hypothetical protein